MDEEHDNEMKTMDAEAEKIANKELDDEEDNQVDQGSDDSDDEDDKKP
jgi:hypothetical protein